MGIEGGHSIEDSLALLRDYYRLGVRYMTLTWSNTNNWADSSGDIDDPAIHHHDGLTPFGKQVVQEMNRLGMMVDISHVSDKTFWDTIAITHTPIIASPSPTPPPTRSTASSPQRSAAPPSTHSSITSTTSLKSPASTTSASAPTSTASPSHPRASTPPPISPR